MAANNSNGQNKSLYIYTSLIFVVAVLLIILSFFAMSNRDSKMNETEQTAQSITEKTAALSEENKNLAEENKALKEKNHTMSAALLNIANEYYTAGDTVKAEETVAIIDASSLTEEEAAVYTTITATPEPVAAE